MSETIYIKRDLTGKISSISVEQQEGYTKINTKDHDLQAFLNRYSEAAGSQSLLLKTDIELARVLEDMIDLLTQKGVFQFTELPEAAQKKLLHRQKIRRSKNNLNILGDDEDNSFMS